MSSTPKLSGAAATIGVTGLAALVLAVPVSARQDPGTGALPRNPNQSVATVGPVGAGTGGAGTETASLPGRDPGVGYVQLVLTGLAGAVIVGVGVGVVTAGSGRRRHAHTG